MRIEDRFCGPRDSANGGYACGVAAALLDGDVEVTLRLPPPLDAELTAERTDGGAVVRDGDRVIAEAKPTTLALEVPAPVGFDEAVRASRGYPWFEGHPYPTCFVCGPERTAGDGLRIFPGAVEGRDVAAAPWVPDASLAGDDGLVRPAFLWAALDCPSWFGFGCLHPFDGMVLLGRLAARIVARPRAGDRCVAMGWLIARDGRKIHCGSAIHTDGGALLAVGKATWIALK